MRAGRPSWTTKCPPETLRLAEEGVAAQAQTARDLWDELNLRRFVRFTTFQLWVTRFKRERRARGEPQMAPTNAEREWADGDSAGSPSASPTSSADGSDPGRYLLNAMLRQAAGGRVGKLDLARGIGAWGTLERLKFEARADKRAAELHELKLAELRSKFKQVVNEKSSNGETPLTREDVYDLVDKVMRGAA